MHARRCLGKFYDSFTTAVKEQQACHNGNASRAAVMQVVGKVLLLLMRAFGREYAPELSIEVVGF